MAPPVRAAGRSAGYASMVWSTSATAGLEHDETAAPTVPGPAELPSIEELMPDGAGGRREHCALPHLLAEGTPLTGLWQEHIGGGSSWRLGLHQRGNRIEAVVYGFDDAGEARWLAGSTRWRGSGAVSIALWRQRGCDDCERPWQEQSPAGTLTVRPAAAGQTGTLQADIHAVLAAGAVVRRQNVTLVPSVP